jgi:hypothetical protein
MFIFNLQVLQLYLRHLISANIHRNNEYDDCILKNFQKYDDELLKFKSCDEKLLKFESRIHECDYFRFKKVIVTLVTIITHKKTSLYPRIQLKTSENRTRNHGYDYCTPNFSFLYLKLR